MSDDIKERARQSYEILLRLAFPILLGVAGYTLTSIFDHEDRLDRIEASRYTVQDASADARAVQAEIGKVNERLAVIETLLRGGQ